MYIKPVIYLFYIYERNEKKKYLTVETIPKSIEKLYKDAKSIPLTHIYITAHWILFAK
jgi:hypothetical protein